MSSANRFKKQGNFSTSVSTWNFTPKKLITDDLAIVKKSDHWFQPILIQPTSLHALTPSIPDSEFLKDFLLPTGDLSSKARTPGYCDKCQANTGDQCETAGLFLIYAGSERISVCEDRWVEAGRDSPSPCITHSCSSLHVSYPLPSHNFLNNVYMSHTMPCHSWYLSEVPHGEISDFSKWTKNCVENVWQSTVECCVLPHPPHALLTHALHYSLPDVPDNNTSGSASLALQLQHWDWKFLWGSP